MSELTHKPGIPMSEKEYAEIQAMFQRIADGSFADTVEEERIYKYDK